MLEVSLWFGFSSSQGFTGSPVQKYCYRLSEIYNNVQKGTNLSKPEVSGWASMKVHARLVIALDLVFTKGKWSWTQDVPIYINSSIFQLKTWLVSGQINVSKDNLRRTIRTGEATILEDGESQVASFHNLFCKKWWQKFCHTGMIFGRLLKSCLPFKHIFP